MSNLSQQPIQILGQILESGSTVYLVSIAGEYPEPMSKVVLTELVQPPQYLSWKWDQVIRANTQPDIVTVSIEKHFNF